ncbi:glycosyl transferase [Streptomyces eurocidicus]|uniref:Glycosyl transferase n=1 Tax=Streptomyces eurocidicus TaxID=66423 RepID=A0A2N8NUB3_STREU|nr:glycosyltransferase [Streptomyces eurocidicus]MBB5120200.1 MGT family glycosyltransferase [Streptomyces eurocidicus]MBF6056115.1 glycosyltransferase [Streptomyces eurocidicus]PNE32356.1 glycosyl transferase [Streptomyces eurocidicus]
MSGFLFVVPPFAGHVNPTIGVAAELVRRGHRVAWAGPPYAVEPLVGASATVFPCAARGAVDPRAPAPDAWSPPPEQQGAAALMSLWEHCLEPLAEAMAPGVLAAVREFRPDVLVADQQALAGGLVAERLGIPWATSATTSAESTALAGTPQLRAWLDGRIQDLRRRVGVRNDRSDPRRSDHLVLMFTTEALAGPAGRFGAQVRLVGPSLAPRPRAGGFPWHRLDGARPTVLITLGTVSGDAGARFLPACAAAVRERSGAVQAVIADPSGTVRDTGDGILVLPHVPQLTLLERCSAVLCHGGHNTVCEALWHGLPLVVAPVRYDQPVIASQVVRAGAGLRVRFRHATADRIGAALDAVLGEPRFRAAARGVGESFRAAGGAAAAASHLGRLAARTAAIRARAR